MKEIIVLDTNPSDGGMVTVHVAFWFAIPAGQQWPLASGASSIWSGASAAEIQAIQQGSVVEESRVFQFPATTATAAIKSALVAAYTARQTWRASQPFIGQYYGVYYDGTTWSA